ncbi:insulinase family protein [Candidatus Poribacteria bacterium]|nr:insulinase family protein [Candidatus Poribacteria bacterium]
MDYQQTVLPNGLRLVTIHRPHTMTTAMRIYVRAGSRYDGAKPGIAHFVEHLLFRGTVNRTSKQLYAEIENLGGVIEAGTTREYTTFYVVLMNKYLRVGIDVLADIMIYPAFEREAHWGEKLIVLEELRRAQDRGSFIWGFFLQNLWLKTPLRNPILGDIQGLKAIEHEDVLEFYRKHYVAKNMVISICGDIAHEDVAQYLSERFAQLPSGEEQRPSQAIEPALSGIRRAHVEKDIHQTHLIMGVPAVSMKAEDRYAIKLMDKILGTGGSSRLFQELREQEGVVYSVYSQAPLFEERGYFAVYAACSPENLQALEDSIVSEWHRMRAEPVTDEELQRAKKSYEGTIAREFETNLAIASIAGIEALFHRIEPFEASIQSANSVTQADILKAANHYLHPDRYVIVTIGRKS